MGNGLVAQWRRRIVGRGLAGALLLSLPVAVAAALGFSGAFSDFGSGLRAIGSVGGDSPDATQTSPLNQVVVPPSGAAAGPAGAGAAGGAEGGGDAGSFVGGGDDGSSGGVGGGSGGGSGGTGGGVGAGSGTIPQAPSVDLPATDDPGGTGSLVDGVGDTVNGLLPGQ